jgi:Leucine-rich repeat (LRR) protein
VRTIDLTSNKLAELPPFLGSFSVLSRLTLSRNLLTQLPTEACNLTSLKVGGVQTPDARCASHVSHWHELLRDSLCGSV